MILWVQRHPVVMGNLRVVDLENKSVRFGDNCEARFGRVESAGPFQVGPAATLEFKSSNCPIGAEQHLGGS